MLIISLFFKYHIVNNDLSKINLIYIFALHTITAPLIIFEEMVVQKNTKRKKVFFTRRKRTIATLTKDKFLFSLFIIKEKNSKMSHIKKNLL